jgi:hypothetical protein
MPHRHSLLIALSLLLPVVGSALAFEPHDIEILTLRLAMPAAEVASRLRAQGSAESQWTRVQRPCPGQPAGDCLAMLSAPTKDGWLEIAFSTRQTVLRIGYTLRATGAGEPAIIRTSVLDRFGPPTDAAGMAWCRRPNERGTCPTDEPILHLTQGAGVAMVLTLAEGEQR